MIESLSLAGWYVLVGLILLSMGLIASRIKKLPLTSAILYLLVGLAVGPTGLHLFHFNPLQQSGLLEVVTEIAVILSLFTAGLKLQLPVTNRLWWIPLRLAFVSMAVSVGLLTLFGHYVMGLPLGLAVLLGAILAPTDPVLATDIQVKDANDYDRLRFSLTSEAGLNDGSAFPFVMLGLGLLGLHDLGEGGSYWLWHDLIWAIFGGLGIGILCGHLLARLIHFLRQKRLETPFMDDFLGLGLIAFSYGVALFIETYAFIAVFTAAVSLRQTEQWLADRDHTTHKPSKTTRQLTIGKPNAHEDQALLSNRSLQFNEQLERISEVLLIVLLGGSLFVNSWSWEAVIIACFVLFVARPTSVMIGLAGAKVPAAPTRMMAWFGVRGIGSLYYLMYAIQHGLPESQALQLLSVTLIVITLSIVMHGISVKPLMAIYQKPKPKQWQ